MRNLSETGSQKRKELELCEVRQEAQQAAERESKEDRTVFLIPLLQFYRHVLLSNNIRTTQTHF